MPDANSARAAWRRPSDAQPRNVSPTASFQHSSPNLSRSNLAPPGLAHGRHPVGLFSTQRLDLERGFAVRAMRGLSGQGSGADPREVSAAEVSVPASGSEV